jgi:hypothetical protein
MKHHVFAISLVILGFCGLVVKGGAQDVVLPSDVYKINYFANNGVAGAPDATVRIDNPGTAGGSTNLCAMIYVFDNDQQLSECCGCITTPNGLRTLSVGKNLTNNPLTGTVSNNGVIKIVSTLPNNSPCDPTGGAAAAATLRAWASHVQNKVGGAYPVTESEFSDATLSPEEQAINLETQCFFAVRLGSGKGVCTCGTGD